MRGQLYDVRLSSVPRGVDPLNWNRGALLNYYTQQGGWTPGGSGTDNNGNVKLAQHWVPDGSGGYNWMNQYYEYDALNRLSWVKEQQNGTGAYTGEQHYTYDRWGNRLVNATDTSGYLIPEPQFELSPPLATQEVAEPSNRLYAPGDANRAPSQKLMRYDKAGNLVHYESFPGGGGRTYDAENRMTEAWGYSTVVGSPYLNRYVYDAAGKRMRRQTDAGEVWQVYGFDGEVLAEYAAAGAPSQPQKEYGYRSGELLVVAEPGRCAGSSRITSARRA